MHQARLCCDEPFGNDLRVTLTDSAGGQITLLDNLVVGQAWQENEVWFLATETQYTLRFESTDAVSTGGPGNDRSVLLDDVRLHVVAPPLTPTTDLPLGPTTYYFRHEFSFDGDPGEADLTFNGIVDDGAVLYLNGTEVARINMPEGVIAAETFAATPVGDPAFRGAVTIPADQLVAGSNVLAAEVHQAAADGGDMVFGLELTQSVGAADLRVPLTPLAINEVGAAEDGAVFVELVNIGGAPIDVTGHVIASSGDPDRPLVIAARPPLSPGEYLTFDQPALGFTPSTGQRLFLYGPGQTTLVDAVRVADRTRGRQPDGQGRWLVADVPTPGADNQFALHDDDRDQRDHVSPSVGVAHRFRSRLRPARLDSILVRSMRGSGRRLRGGRRRRLHRESGYGWTDGSVSCGRPRYGRRVAPRYGHGDQPGGHVRRRSAQRRLLCDAS